MLDIDTKSGGAESLDDLEMLNGRLPHTIEVITGSGGRHVYFKHPGIDLRNSAGRVGAGLDIRGDGGYVVAPPSLHPSGNNYCWEISSHPDDTPLADMPKWLLDRVAEPTRRNGHDAQAQLPKANLPIGKQALDFVANGAPVGQQRDRAIRAIRSYLGAGYPLDETVAAIWRGLQASPCGNRQRPWTYQDAENMVHDLASRPAPPPSLPSNPAAAAAATNPTGAKLPTIYASCQDLREITDDCWAAIKGSNKPEPHYFRHGGMPSRMEIDDQGAPVIREMTADRLRHELARIAHWKARKLQKDGSWIETDARPPLDVMRDILATPNPPLPVLTRIVEVPVFAADGTLQTTPGYHPAARTYHAPAHGVFVPAVPEQPTSSDVGKARDLIEEAITDFPFVDIADRAHAIALLLLPFVRDMIDGPTPNHLIEAPIAGSGKGLLADVLTVPSVGSHVGVVTTPRDDDELRKRLTSQLKEGRAVILLDNVNDLSSGTLAAALTALTWDDRVLGKTEMLSLAVRCAWVTTANNPTMSTEIARRCVRIRLDPKRDRPWQREGFRHPNLRGWVTDHRGELVWAALTLVQAWLSASRPDTTAKPLGSYERWTSIIGGILEHAGMPGFLSNLNEFYEAADLEGAMWRQFVAAWWEKHAENQVGTAELFPLAQDTEIFDLGKGGERSQRSSFGRLLARQRDRVIGDYRIIQAGKSQRLSKWRLLPIKNLLEESVLSVHPCTFPYSSYAGEQNLSYAPDPKKYTEVHKVHPNPPPPLFNVTEDWQELPDGYMLPNGCEVRLNQTTGTKHVRLDPRSMPVEDLSEPDPEYFYEDHNEWE